MKSSWNPNLLEAGVDEAGRGCLIGDVFIGAVILPPDIINIEGANGIKDSKKLSRKKRLIMKDFIEKNAIAYSVSHIGNEEIDKVNILNATLKGMHQAIDGLGVRPEHLLVDGNRFNLYVNNGEVISHSCIIGGDNIYLSIAAASILAKVAHDKAIENLCERYPILDSYYDLRNNMGYGTKSHMKGIAEYGISPFHRKSFSPCKIDKIIPLD